MSGFVATVPAAAEPEGGIISDGWFPDIDLDNLRETIRLQGEITLPRLRAAAIDAMLAVNRDLAGWRLEQEVAGHASLAAVPAPAIDGTSRLVHLYRRAVYSTVKADLTERYRDIDTTASGAGRADDLTPSIDEQRRNARWAIRDILGLPRTTVELI